MSLKELKAIVAPPQKPLGTGSTRGWKDVEKKLGTALPDDYKEIIDTYGIGWFGNWVCIYSPFHERYNLPKRHEDICCWIRESIEDDPESFPPYPLFPTKGGLLFVGQSDNAEAVCYVTEGNPEDWSIVTMDNKYLRQYYNHFETGLAEMLVKWLSGEIEGECIREKPNQTCLVFTPGLRVDDTLFEAEEDAY